MAANNIAVCNQALRLLGLTTIDDFTSNDKGVTCGDLYEDNILSLLGLHPWRFAMRKAQLTRDATAPVGEWEYAYQLPSDMIGEPWAAFSNEAVGSSPFTDWEVFVNDAGTQRLLLTNAIEVFLDYMIRIAETKWPGYFTTFAVEHMASVLAEPLTDDTSKAEFWRARAYGTPGEDGMGGSFRKARGASAKGSPSQSFPDSPFVDVRQGWF